MVFQNEYINDGSGFRQIEPLSLTAECLDDFSIYEKRPLSSGQFRFRCLLADPASLPRQRLLQLLKSWESVYIHKDQSGRYQQHISNHLAQILANGEIDITRKTRTLIDYSSDVLSNYFEATFSDADNAKKSIAEIQMLVSKVITFISDIDSLSGIAQLVGHDYDTHTHSIKVGWLMAAFINSNKDLFPEVASENFNQFLLQSAVAGYLHDIGKVKIPKNILNKNGKLDNLEYNIVQCHTAYSLSLLFDSGLTKSAMQAILYHHENEDGSGYPCGLKADQIPVIAKLSHVVDVFDALTSKRHYKDSKTPYEALKIMTGINPHVETLNKFEKEAKENPRIPVTAIVRDDYDAKLRRLREKEMLEEEAQKRVEARMKLRDKGMAHCFNTDILRRFIFTINQSNAFDLSRLF